MHAQQLNPPTPYWTMITKGGPFLLLIWLKKVPDEGGLTVQHTCFTHVFPNPMMYLEMPG